MNKNKWLIYVLFVVIFFLTISLIFTFHKIKNIEKMKGQIKRDSSGFYSLTSPILDYEEASSLKESVLPVGLVNKKIEHYEDNTLIDSISFYYRDLNNGQWIGVGEKDLFSPASLLKVPIFMALLKRVEKDEYFLDKKIVAEERFFSGGVKQDIAGEQEILLNNEYTVFQTAKIMIIDSDNTAAQMLIDQLEEDEIREVFDSIGVTFIDKKTEASVRVKDYAGFFRVLYNASYLNREMSELALSVLSNINFRKGLVESLPNGVVVAHKFGERSLIDKDTGSKIIQIHDCGIVYYPENPYIICIMTKGRDLELQEDAIADISKFMYDNINKLE